LAKIAARNARILVGGRDVSCRSNNVTLTMSAEAPEVTTFCDDNRSRLAGGIKDVEMSLDGFYDTAASNVDELYYYGLAASNLVGLYPNGYTACRVGREFTGIITSYESTFATEDAAATAVTFSGSPPLLITKSLYYGTLSGAGASDLASANFTDGSSGSQYIIVRLLTLTGTTPEFSASVQESSDDASFTTIYAVESASLPSAGSPFGASISLISSASQYRRVAASLSGTSPCATFFVASGSKVGAE